MFADVVINLIPSTIDENTNTALFLILVTFGVCFVAQLIYRFVLTEARQMYVLEKWKHELKLAEITKKTPPTTESLEEDLSSSSDS